MQYVIDGKLIKSENAAKPISQRSKFLKEFILSMDFVDNAFDYGCGKLRYVDIILQRTNSLAIVDSEVQLSRQQRLYGNVDTIRNLYKASNNVSVYNNLEFTANSCIYRRAYCLNVLSAMPSYEARHNLLRLIKTKLKCNGSAVFVVQYRNSDFTRMLQKPNATPWMDGFIINSLRGYSFYGLISPESLKNMLIFHGYRILETTLNEGSVYIVAST